MTLLLLSTCFSYVDEDEDWGDAPPSDEPVAEAAIASESESLPPAPEGMINLCVNGAPGFRAPVATWVFATKDGQMGQVELKTPWGQSRCGLIQRMFARSGLTFRSQDPFPAGTIAGMSYRFDDGTLYGADYVNGSSGGPGYFEMTFSPVVPPGE